MFGLFRKKLPGCDSLFEKYLSPWYDEENRPKMPRPDIYRIAAFEGKPLDMNEVQYLTQEYLIKTRAFVHDTMTNASLADFGNIYKAETINFELLDAVDKHYDRARIAALIKESDPKDFSNPYLVTVCEFGIMLGQLFDRIDGYGWLYSDPYFHSSIVHANTGLCIPVFDWAVKKFSEYGVDDGYVAKFNAAISYVNNYIEENKNNS